MPNDDDSLKIKRLKTEPKTSTGKKIVKKRKVIPKHQLALLTPPDLSMYAICWIKVRGYKDWPGVIENFKNGKYDIHFFGDYTTARVNKSQITNFYEGFNLFNSTFDDILLQKAIQEACICLMGASSPSVCYVCSIIGSKKT